MVRCMVFPSKLWILFFLYHLVVCMLLLQRVFVVRSWTTTVVGRPSRRPLVGSRCWATTTTSTTASYDELVAIAAELRRHDELYYNQAAPIVDDATYDALADREATLLRAHPDWLPRIRAEYGGMTATRWQGRVGAAVTDLDEEEGKEEGVKNGSEKRSNEDTTDRISRSHAAPMLSLDNVYDADQLVQWIGRVSKRILAAEAKVNATSSSATNSTSSLSILSEPKLDGLSLSVRYEKTAASKWELQWAATRGDGRKGTDVTEAVRSMTKAIPPTLSKGLSSSSSITALEVRGEVILPVAAWQRNTTNLTNARNAASGILLRKTSHAHDTDLRSQLEFYAYDLVMMGAENDTITDDGYALRQQLQAMGFATPEPHSLTQVPLQPENTSEIQPLLDYQLAQQTQQSNTASSLLQCDGCVHKLQSFRTIVGTRTRAPRWAVAYKFATTITGTTRLLRILPQVGRTGVITPVAEVEPVVLAGVTVQRATLHHFGHAQQLFRASSSEDEPTSVPVGTIVTIRRAGDVIPQILTATIVPSDATVELISLTPPTHCPACGAPTVCNHNASGSITRCHNPIPWECPPRAVAGLQHAFGRDALDLKGLSGARLEQLRNASLVRWPSDIWTIARNPDRRAQWLELDGWGEKSVTKLCTAAEQIAEGGVSLARFIRALNIPLAGTHASELLADVYGTVEAFLCDVREANFDRLADDDDAEATKGIGPLLIASLVEYAGSVENVQAAEDLADKVLVHAVDNGKESKTTKSKATGPFANLSVVFTGTLPNKLKRPEAQELAKQILGAKTTPTSVSKTTGLVVVGQRGGKKQKQAEEYGIRIMSAEDFVALVEEHKGDNDDAK